MGAEESTNLPPVQTDPHCLCLIIKIPDKIQIINGSTEEYTLIQKAISKTWGEGIQAVKQKCGNSVLSFKCNGLPFETGIVSHNSRDVVCEIITHLHNIGWHHLASTNLTCARDWFTFIFTKQRPIEFNYVGYMSLSSTDKLKFANLLSGTFEGALEAVKAYGPGGYPSEPLEYKKNHLELTLNGSPWNGKSYEHAEARYLLIKMFALLLRKHHFVCTMNIKRTEDTFVLRSRSTTENLSESDFVIISLRKTKKIQIYNSSEDLAEILHQLINETLHSRGVKVHERKIEYKTRKIEYKFTFPNKAYANLDTSKAFVIKFFICKLLEVMRAYGWKILTGFDMTRGLSYKSELLFQRGTFLDNCSAFCLSPLEGSRLALVNAPNDIVAECTQVIKSYWHKPLKNHTEIENIVRYHVIHLDGDPWNGTGIDAYYAHGIMCKILKKFSEKGYALVLTADVINDYIEYDHGKSYAHNPNAWWFLHGPENWQPPEPSAPPPVGSELSASNVPSVSSVLKDEYKEPPTVDDFAHPRPITPTAPSLNNPSETCDSNDNGAFVQEQLPPPPSYESVMRKEGRM